MEDITILFEDNDIVAINKPAGLVVHADGKTKEPALTDWIMKKYPEALHVGEPIVTSAGETILRPGIVHRIDRETSGVLLIAKNAAAFIHLKTQFQEREVAKKYNAFVYGEMKQDEGVIDRPIGRSKNDFRKWTAQRGARGTMRDAVTEYTVLARGKGATFVEARPKTGRTHQIRVHFKAINYPVVGDSLYAENKPAILGFERLALHARSIEFVSIKGKKITVEAPLPSDFEWAQKEMGK
jgi:23S rRNA pseudouridine1911/1915/1917 synthase